GSTPRRRCRLDVVLDSQTAATVAAIGTVVAAGTAVVYTIVTWCLLRQTRRQAEIAALQATTAQRMLDAARRPYISVALFADLGTSSQVLNMASVLKNHGNVPATVTGATLRARWEGKTSAAGDQLKPNQVPSQLCIFPGDSGELTWGIADVSFAPWPKEGFFRFEIEIQYRGAFERGYKTT